MPSINFSVELNGLIPIEEPLKLDASWLMAKDLNLKSRLTRDRIGFYDWPKQIPESLPSQINQMASDLRKTSEATLIIGIGGSQLGPALILDSCRSLKDQEEHPIHWLANVEAHSIRQAEAFITKHSPCSAIVISKSGSTFETLSGFLHLSQHFTRDNTVIITDPHEGLLRTLATDQAWRSLEVPSQLGGRFSVLSSVGLMPAALGGISPEQLLSGASAMRDYFDGIQPKDNPAYLLAAHLHYWDQSAKHPIQYLMPYHSELRLLSDWFVQLWGESLGKINAQGVAVGPTPATALGTRDQHSLLQLIKEGPRDKVVGFVTIEPQPTDPVFRAPAFKAATWNAMDGLSFGKMALTAALATETSLRNSGIPSFRIHLKTLDAKTLGSLLFFFETACGFAGELYDVNAYDQPGVEDSKTIFRKLLSG